MGSAITGKRKNSPSGSGDLTPLTAGRKVGPSPEPISFRGGSRLCYKGKLQQRSDQEQKAHFTHLIDLWQKLTHSFVFLKQNEVPSFSLDGKVITIPFSKSVHAPPSLGLEATAVFCTQCPYSLSRSSNAFYKENRVRGRSLVKLYQKKAARGRLLQHPPPPSSCSCSALLPAPSPSPSSNVL